MSQEPKKHDFIPVVCRPAGERDTISALALTQLIWEGDDYVPYVWDEWLADSQGVLAVAEFANQLVAFGKLTRLSEEDWWLEGMRVHPEFEGRGVASQLNQYLLEYWQQTGNGAIRLATSSERTAIHRICARNGFQKVAEFRTYRAPAIEAGDDLEIIFQPLREEDLPSALSFIQKSEMLELQYGLFDLGWQWAPSRPGYLLESVEAGQAWWWRNHRGLLLVSEFDDAEHPTTLVRGLACKPQQLTDMLYDYRLLAGDRGRAEAKWHAPVKEEVGAILEACDYESEADHSIYIFERK